MPLVRDVMTRRPVCVSPDDTVRTAMELLRAEQLEVLPVARDGAVLGSVGVLGLFRLYGEMPITEAVAEPLPVIPADAPVGLAAARMLQTGARALAVMRGEELVGLLTERDLAASWGSVPDPLTGLPWQDQMRRWAASHLTRGREIAILFLDLNGFGAFNKQHGHVLGDRILQAVAEALRVGIEPEHDTLCRYGGDEFVVATTRPLLQARALALALRCAVGAVRVDGEALPVSAAIGIAGGQRVEQRPGTHPAATLDDLINLASRASTHAKSLPDQCCAVQNGGPAEPGAPGLERFGGGPVAGQHWARWGPEEVRTRLEGYQVTQRAGEVAVSVALRRGPDSAEGRAAGPGEAVRQALGEATVAALAHFLPPGLSLGLAEIYTCGTGAEGEVVGVAVALTPPEGPRERLFGAAPALPDPARAIVHAVLDATNRRLGYWFGRLDSAGLESSVPCTSS